MRITDKDLKMFLEETGHELFGPSSMPRIVRCPASAGETLRGPRQGTSSYAEHGTLLHKATEEQLRRLYFKEERETYIYDDLDVVDQSYVITALDYAANVIALHPPGEATIYIEAHADCTSFGMPEVQGTVDFGVISAKRADSVDWKFGSGVPRIAYDEDTGEWDEQGVCYLGGLLGFDPQHPDMEVYSHICQPPLNLETHGRTDLYPGLVEMLSQYEGAVLEARGPNPKYNPGEHQCRFCVKKRTCEARANMAENTAIDIYNNMLIPTVDPKVVLSMLERAPVIESYIKDLKQYVTEQIMAGNADFSSYKLVAGRSNRVWKDEAAVAKLFAGEPFEERTRETKILSPSRMEKLLAVLKRESGVDIDISDHITKPPGKPTLVPSIDKRKALVFKTESAFE